MPLRYYITGALFIGSIITGIVLLYFFSQSIEKPGVLLGTGLILISAVPFFLGWMLLRIRKTGKRYNYNIIIR